MKVRGRLEMSLDATEICRSQTRGIVSRLWTNTVRCMSHRMIVQENLLGGYVTVLKLTQVGEMRILRRSGEHWLRNSAKWPRTFAIRGARVIWPQ